jgi:hypothetical protein
MRTLSRMTLVAALLAAARAALAHDGAPDGGPGNGPEVAERAEAAGLAGVEGSVVVDGRVNELKALLLVLPRWPAVFSDVRGLGRAEPAGPWRVDFRRFGHPHAFAVTRGATGVVLELAQGGHGEARLEYRLRALDAARSTLTVHLAMTPPPTMSRADAVTLLRGKAAADLADFARAARGAASSARSGGEP